MRRGPTRKGPRLSAALGAWVLLAALVLGPIGGLIAGTIFVEKSDDVVPAPLPVSATVRQSEFDDAREVQLAFSWIDGEKVLAPAWAGVVTDVYLAAGDVLQTGTRVMAIDGIDRIAANTPSPFYSVITHDSPPAQIRMLNGLLAALGFSHSLEGQWGAGTSRGVRGLAADLGAVPVSGQTFDPAWVIWLPSANLVPALVSVETGMLAPSAGEPLLQGPPSLALAKVSANESGSLPTVDAQEEWMLDANGVQVPFSGPDIIDPAQLKALTPDAPVARPEYGLGSVHRAVPIAGWEVPTSALFIDKDGARCVFTDDAVKGEYQPTSVSVLSGKVGVARVTGELSKSANILVNPASILPGASCVS